MSVDVVIIGSGIGGLSCGALLARYGLRVVVCESHAIAGGAAHGFERNGYRFDSGPSLYSGLSYRPSPNPLRQVLDAIDEDAEWVTYDAWGCCLPEGNFPARVGSEHFSEILRELRGENAVREWQRLQEVMKPLSSVTQALSPAMVRFDMGAILTVGRYLPNFFPYLFHASKLSGTFGPILEGVVSDRFIRDWMDLLCFLLSGFPADKTSAAEMAFMFADWYRSDVVLDYPIGGSAALVEALVRGLEKYGGELRLNAHVQEIILENNRAIGVKIRGGQEIRARLGVVSNASIWDTRPLLPKGTIKGENPPALDSFLHLHLGIDGQDLPTDLICHYIVVNDWTLGITAPGNVIAISIPSLLDPSLAPPGKHTIHVYTPANEPYALWQGLERGSEAYERLKAERAEIMWKALERVIPDIRSRCEVTLVGTPLTHARFLRRYRGSYGPGLAAGKEFFPSGKTNVDGLWCCGDSTFPGIGLPAVAASGMMVANTFASIAQHFALLEDIGAG
jgi:phytoene dehydrogenase-like protein